MSLLSGATRLARSMGGRRIVFSVGFVLAVSWEAHALFSTAAPIRAAGKKPFVVSDFGRGVPIGQTFRMLSDGLDAADVRFISNEVALLAVRCRLLEAGGRVPGHWSAVQDWMATIRLPRGSSQHRFTFDPVVPSFNRIYQFQVQQIDARAAPPNNAGEPLSVGVVGSIDDSLRDGNIVVGDTQMVDRDLLFEARAADSTFAEFRRHAQTQLPKPLRSAAAQLTLLAIYNGCLAVFAFHMLVQEPENNEASS